MDVGVKRDSKWAVALLCLSVAFTSVAAAQVPAPPVPAPPDSAPTPGPPYLVSILVKGLRIGGRVFGGIYRDAALWTEEGGAVSTCSVRVRAHQAICTFSVLRPGRYAAAFFHDWDGDGVIDKNFLGIPTEGYAFSRDVSAVFSAPAFGRAAFDVPLRSVVSATMRY